eukprot:983265-Prorocentrum_minimum.AAC.1
MGTPSSSSSSLSPPPPPSPSIGSLPARVRAGKNQSWEGEGYMPRGLGTKRSAARSSGPWTRASLASPPPPCVRSIASNHSRLMPCQLRRCCSFTAAACGMRRSSCFSARERASSATACGSISSTTCTRYLAAAAALT